MISARISRSAPGFTLMEIMIYLAIVGMILAATVTGYMGYQASARKKTTAQVLLSTKQAITLFYTEFGKYPSRLEDLVEKPKGDIGKKWDQFLEKIPKDAWGRELIYRVTSGGKHPYELYSTAGAEEGEEDPESIIDVWKL